MKFTNILLFFVVCVSCSNGLSFSYVYLKYFKRKAIEIIDRAGPKDDCSRHLKSWVGDLFNLKKLWAMKMLDASAKLQPGFLAGNIFHFGNFDECLAIREDKGEVGLIEGQYCTLAITPAKNITSDLGQILDFSTSITDILGIPEGKDLKPVLKLVKVIYGICLPKSCSAESIQKLWNYVEFSFRLPVHVAAGDDFCSSRGKVPHVFSFDTVVFWGFGLFFSFICFATIYDMMFVENDEGGSFWYDVLTSFSIRKNAVKIFDIRPSANDDKTFSCINGLKAISMMWVVFGHRYTLGFFSGTVNMLNYFEWRKTFPALFIILAPFSVDTFLVISGLLLAFKYMQLREILPPNKPFPYFIFYFMRLLRLWPGLIATILLYTNIIKYLTDGPLWPLFAYRMALACRYTGWVTALFATNFVSFHFQCLEPTWYLAVDTQLYCIAPFLMYFLYKHPKRTTIAFITLSFTLALYTYCITVSTSEKWTPSEGDDSYHSRIYQSTIVRMPAWIFGVLAGTLLYHFQQMRIPKTVVTFIWVLIAAIFLGVTMVNHMMMLTPYNEFNAGMFNALVRPAWGIAICLIIVLCATGHGGAVNNILSLNIYKPLIKMSYSVYLLHTAVIILLQGGKRSPTFHNSFTSFHGYLGDLPFILFASFVWCLAFESPFVNLGKLILKRGKSGSDFTKAIALDDKKRLRKIMWEPKELLKRKHSKSKKKFN